MTGFFPPPFFVLARNSAIFFASWGVIVLSNEFTLPGMSVLHIDSQKRERRKFTKIHDKIARLCPNKTGNDRRDCRRSE